MADILYTEKEKEQARAWMNQVMAEIKSGQLTEEEAIELLPDIEACKRIVEGKPHPEKYKRQQRKQEKQNLIDPNTTPKAGNYGKQIWNWPRYLTIVLLIVILPILSSLTGGNFTQEDFGRGMFSLLFISPILTVLSQIFFPPKEPIITPYTEKPKDKKTESTSKTRENSEEHKVKYDKSTVKTMQSEQVSRTPIQKLKESLNKKTIVILAVIAFGIVGLFIITGTLDDIRFNEIKKIQLLQDLRKQHQCLSPQRYPPQVATTQIAHVFLHG